jgi:pilus assembly protein Flp/PilA
MHGSVGTLLPAEPAKEDDRRGHGKRHLADDHQHGAGTSRLTDTDLSRGQLAELQRANRPRGRIEAFCDGVVWPVLRDQVEALEAGADVLEPRLQCVELRNLKGGPQLSVVRVTVQNARFARKEVIAMSRRFDRRQRGQGMVEYALILVLVSIVVIVILLTMGNQIQNVFSNVVAALG